MAIQEPPRKKRQTEDRTTGSGGAQDEGYTSSDSSTGDTLQPIDWRLCEVKTAYAAADESVRQCWHWIEEDGVLEHRVLQRVGHITGWRAYRDPVNFHVRVGELSQVSYSEGGLRVIIERTRGRVTKGSARLREKVGASFPRKRTKRRFLEFMKTRGVNLIKTTSETIDGTWNCITPAVLLKFVSAQGVRGEEMGSDETPTKPVTPGEGVVVYCPGPSAVPERCMLPVSAGPRLFIGGA
jgi:hypothetical protein